MSEPAWINTIPDSPLRLRFAESPEVPDVPAKVLASSPSGCTWFGGTGQRWIATLGEGGPEEKLLRFDGERWLDTGLRGVGWVCPDEQGRLLAGVHTLYAIDLGADAPARPWLASEERIFASVHHGDAIVLLSKGRLSIVREGEVRSYRIERDAMALRSFANVLLVGERVEVEGPPFEKDIIHVLTLAAGVPRRIARFQSTGEASEWEHNMSIEVEFVGPFEGPFASAHKGVPMTGPHMSNEGRAVVIEGLDDALANAASLGEALEACDPLPVSFELPDPIAPTPVETEPFEPGPPDLSRMGPLATWLLEQIRSRGPRPEPDAEVLELLAIPMPPDLYAFLHTWAHYRANVDFDAIDWWVDVKPRSLGGWLTGEAPAAIQIGTMGSGDPYVVQVFDAGRARWTNFDDEGCEYFTASSLEGLLKNLRSHAHGRGETTVLDGVGA